MNIVIFNSEREGTLTLTTNAAGHPVLRAVGSPRVKDGDYAPSDLMGDPEYPMYAASHVYSWALERCRSDAGIAAAQSYLRQWPDGPQAEPEDIERGRAEHDALLRAAEDLNAGAPTFDQMSPEQLRDYIDSSAKRLADDETDSATAYLLQLRVGLAATLLYGFYFRASQKSA